MAHARPVRESLRGGEDERIRARRRRPHERSDCDGHAVILSAHGRRCHVVAGYEPASDGSTDAPGKERRGSMPISTLDTLHCEPLTSNGWARRPTGACRRRRTVARRRRRGAFVRTACGVDRTRPGTPRRSLARGVATARAGEADPSDGPAVAGTADGRAGGRGSLRPGRLIGESASGWPIREARGVRRSADPLH